MTRRRTLLVSVSLLLIAGNGLLAWRWYRDGARDAMITYAGFDSIGGPQPANQPAPELRNGSWQIQNRPIPDIAAYLLRRNEPNHGSPVTIISLSSAPTYRHFIETIRDLKARKICNVLLDDGIGSSAHMLFRPRFRAEDRSSKALVLCGNAIGDAGFSGALPPDGPIRLTPLTR